MKTQQELAEILGFVAEYAAYQLGSGVHTSRSIRNSRRIGEALGVDVQLSSFQKSTILTVLDPESGEAVTRVAEIPALPISFERNSDLSAVGVVFTATLVGFAVKQRMQARGVNHFLIFICAAFVASLCASAALCFDCAAEVALATSPLFLVPGVPLINGVIDIVEGHVLIGVSRLVNAMLLIVCIAVGLSATLLMIKDSLL